MNELPDWASEEASRELPFLRAKGEGQHLEYMLKFPDQARDLAKEIAAFATSGGGRILIGVDDTGALVGIEGAGQPSQRDGYLKRVQGIAAGTVDPPVTPKVEFAFESGRAVLCLRVRGREPVYYCEHKPYVRHVTESRPAKPEEVVQRVLSWAGYAQADGGIQIDLSSEHFWKQDLDRLLIDLLIALDEMPRLCMNPGPGHLQGACTSSSQALHGLIVEHLADEPEPAAELKEVADACDRIAWELSHCHSGTWDLLEGICPPLRSQAEQLRRDLLGGPPVDDELLSEASQAIIVAARRARALLGRLDKMVWGPQRDDFFLGASRVGEDVLRFSYYDLPFLDRDDMSMLREAAMDMHLVWYHQWQYSASGAHERLRGRLTEQVTKLEAIAVRLDS